MQFTLAFLVQILSPCTIIYILYLQLQMFLPHEGFLLKSRKEKLLLKGLLEYGIRESN